MTSSFIVYSPPLYGQTPPVCKPTLCDTQTKLSEATRYPNSQLFDPVMPHGSKYGSSVVIVQERQYRPSTTYSVGSSASRSSGTPSGYYSSTMDSHSSSSRSSSASNGDRDRTGTYRTGGSGTSNLIRRSWAIDTNTTLQDGHLTTVKHNVNKGKRDVVIIHHATKHSDPEAPRSSDRYRA